VNSNGKTSIVYYWTLSFLAFRNLKKQKFAYFRVFKFKIIIEPVCFASISKKTSLSKLSLHFASLRYHCHYCPTFQYFLRSLWLQRLVLLLKVSTPQGRICIWTCLHYRGLCYSWRCLHHRGLSCIWTCLHYRGLCYSWRCLHHRSLSCIWMCLHNGVLCCSWRCLRHRGQAASERVCTIDTCLLTVESVRFASKIICIMSKMFASLWK
jgi:hypothetical protein